MTLYIIRILVYELDRFLFIYDFVAPYLFAIIHIQTVDILYNPKCIF